MTREEALEAAHDTLEAAYDAAYAYLDAAYDADVANAADDAYAAYEAELARINEEYPE